MTPAQPPEQQCYARWLERGTWVAVVVLVFTFLIDALGLTTPLVPVEQWPSLWVQPVGAYLQASGMPSGWGWLALLRHGDVAGLAGIALLSGCSLLALGAVLWQAARRRESLFVALCAAQMLVIVLAASGVFSAAH